ncbi:tryptophan halogenase family protein [Alteraurantiacibacter aquimixticola]|uniref:Tryptophan 7-halogenase n=1 Tax=Alteraurantiacibacter aquimixticola TaxID=2489173 RepID=A0A4V4U994_9SPHN|nr:tryptophan halogenase family protein [Alteraurantiacibacter aquimixticola]TIX51097.1 tryptophan 7-halogenase [Alteraurantiacibacter aquimixticola]
MTQFDPGEHLPQPPSDQSLRRVLVVGGGSSGWMAATMLATTLSKDISVELVESEAIGIVGVGEATIPPMQKFNHFVKLDEAAFMAATQGTFKLGIEFHNWGRKGDRYLHQFGAVGREIDALVKLHHWWLLGRLAAAQDGRPYPQFQELYVAQAAARENRFAPAGRPKDQLPNRYTHAYHFDAHLYARHLRSVAEERGAVRHEGRITDVERDGESGFVSAVVLEDGRRLEADLFIDCSGFRSLLLGGALEEEWDDWSRYIPSDRALAVPSKRPDGDIRPYTQGIAHSVGWQWRIPLQHRTGNGHVFASAFSSESEAEERLLATIEGEALDTPRLIKFRTGRRKRAWVKNVVGLGLSSGFLEPLESTSIHFVQSALERLVDYFPTRAMDPALAEAFNRRTEQEWLDVRDFIVAHYHLSEREDSEFWRYTRNMAIPDSLAHVLDVWRARGILDISGGHLFQLGSWSSMLIGQRCLPGGVHALADRADPAYAAQAVRRIADECRTAASRLPKHADFIAGYCAAQPMEMA